MHGLNATPSSAKGIVRDAQAAGVECAPFHYPNDQSLVASARLMSEELSRVARRSPETRISLVTHSMGGLVARACVEDPDLNPGNVDQLIMVAPPTHGSALAQYSFGSDIWEHWLNRADGSPWRRWNDSYADGRGEATADLTPGSKFLTTLNRRGRNPDVAYTLVLGTRGCIDERRIKSLAEGLARALRWVGAADSGDRLCASIHKFDECLTGRGDGVVALRRARLDGVDDTVVLPFSHLEVSGDSDSEVAREARALILQRLRISQKPSVAAASM